MKFKSVGTLILVSLNFLNVENLSKQPISTKGLNQIFVQAFFKVFNIDYYLDFKHSLNNQGRF